MMLNLPLVLFVISGSFVNASQMKSNVEFKLSDDYVYKIYPNRPEKILNPNSVIVVRNVSFLQVKSSLQAMGRLVKKLELTCSEIESLEAVGATNYDYEILKGTFNISSAKNACASNGKKLIEILTSDQLLVLLQKLKVKYMISPAGTTFQPNISNFVFESNRKSFRDGLITTAIFGNKMPLKYDSYLYKNYHLRYIFNGTRAFYDLAPNTLIQEQIICMYKEIEEDSSLAASCRKDYLTLENLRRDFESAVSRYTQAVTNIAKLQEVSSHRAPRGLISGIAIGTMIGGGAAGILTKLFSNSLSIQELEKSSRRTEEVLGQLASRTNLLDVNQIMLNSAINNASKLIRLGMFKDNIHSVKIHANSFSIFLEKRLELLQRLTGTPISSRSYLLSISLPELRRL